MGSYDILANRALSVSFVNCRQANDIKDKTYWGIMALNNCKDLLFDSCTFYRFDAHRDVADATIRNSTPGHMGINAVGSGDFFVENTTVSGRTFINLRPDYGSTWRGIFVFRNCVFVPACGHRVSASLIGISNSGKHNFGYTCYMPEQIIIDSLYLDDTRHPGNYPGPTNRLFSAVRERGVMS